MMLTNQQIEDLLKPIPGDKPYGEDIAFEYIVDQIKEARITDDPDDPLSEWETERRVADWKAVTELSIKALTDLSKDLQIAFWLVESQYKQFAWDGLNMGLKFLIRLSEDFGDGLYPHNAEGKNNLVGWFLNKLYLDFRLIPLYKRGESTFANFRRLNTEDYSKAISETKELLGKLKSIWDAKFSDSPLVSDSLFDALASIEKMFMDKPPEPRVDVVDEVSSTGDLYNKANSDVDIDKNIDIDALPTISEGDINGPIREELTDEVRQQVKLGPGSTMVEGGQTPADICKKIVDIMMFFSNNRGQDPIEIFLRAAEILRHYR